MPLADKLNVNTPDPSVLSPVIFFPTNNVDASKFISETFLLSISAYKPLLSSTFIFG